MVRALKLGLLVVLAGVPGALVFAVYYHVMPGPYSYGTPPVYNALVFGVFYVFCFVPLLVLCFGITHLLQKRKGGSVRVMTWPTGGVLIGFIVTLVFAMMTDGIKSRVLKEHLGLFLSLAMAGAAFGWGWWACFVNRDSDGSRPSAWG